MGRRVWSLVAAVLCVSATHVLAQTAILVGAVMRDSAGHELGGAEVMLPDLKRATVANFLGAFKFDKLPAGRHAIAIRHAGFAFYVDTVVVAEGAHIEREFVLMESARTLDSVRVTAAGVAPKLYVSPGLQEFEERRKSGFGHFIREDVLRKNESSTLAHVVAENIPGVMMAYPGGRRTTQYIASGRKCGNGPVIQGCGKTTIYCWVTLYIDGVLVYDPASDPRMETLPDFAHMSTTQFAAIEYHNASTTPAKYNRTSSDCGTLLLWTREQ